MPSSSENLSAKRWDHVRYESASAFSQDISVSPPFDQGQDGQSYNRSLMDPHEDSTLRRPITNMTSYTPQLYNSSYATDSSERSKMSALPYNENRLPLLSGQGKQTSFHNWTWEIVASILGFACLASIIAVLKSQEDRDLDQWGLLQITPTAVVAFIGTVAKAALFLVLAQILSQLKWLHFQEYRSIKHLRTFNSASRGPIGAAGMLWHRPGLATFAALFMILALLIDPFLQLVFTFPSRLVQDGNQEAVLQYSNGFNTKWPVKDSNPQRRFWEGVYGALGSQPINELAACPSGNCNWPTMKSLGVCGSCTNVTTTVQSICRNEVDTTTIPDHPQAYTVCSYTFQDGTNLEATLFTGPDVGMDVDSDTTKRVGTLWNSTAGKVLFDPSYIQVDGDASFVLRDPGNNTVQDCTSGQNNAETLCTFNSQGSNITVLDSQITNWKTIQWLVGDDTVTPLTDQPACWDCEMYWCEKTFEEPRVENGSALQYGLSTERLRSVTAFSHPNNAPGAYTDGNVSYYFLADQMQGLMKSPLEFEYEVDGDWGLGLGLLVRSYMSTVDQLILNSSDNAWEQGLRDVSADYGLRSLLAGSPDLNMTVSKIAHGLSEYIRTSGNASVLVGQTMIPKAYIKVNWQFLALPAVLFTGSCVMLAATAYMSRTRRIPTWKDDPLALLLYSVQGISPEYIRQDTRHLDVLARSIRVKLDENRPFTFLQSQKTG